MIRKLAYVEKITSLEPIKGADRIEKATILGWECIVKIGEFKVGDLAAFCEIDSILPPLPCFEFLRPRKYRIKTLKLKNVISQGLLLPLSTVKEVDPTFIPSKAKVGDDLTHVLQITKHDTEIDLDTEPEEQVKKSWLQKKISYYNYKLFGFKPVKNGLFPSDVPKTDETRVQNMGGALHFNQGVECYITEKCEGTSGTFVFRKTGNWLAKIFGNGYNFQVCSRNRIVWQSQKGGGCNHHIFKVAKKYNLEEKMKRIGANLAIQAEVIGGGDDNPNIQGNIYRLNGLEMRVFLMYDLDTKKYLTYDEMMIMMKLLDLPMAPTVETSHILQNDIKYYVELSKRQSLINPLVFAEGLVIRAKNEDFSFKSINPEYLLHQELKPKGNN